MRGFAGGVLSCQERESLEEETRSSNKGKRDSSLRSE